LIKNRDASENWYIWDNTREPAPAQKNKRLHPNLNVIEQTSTGRSVTFTSTGFQVTGDDSSVNGDGNTLIYAAFADTREAAFFKDVTTNGNNWTPVNLDYRDSVPDTPTNNFTTLNGNLPDSHFNTDRLSEGNLLYNEGEGNNGTGRPTATFGAISGKWYWEVQVPSQQNNRAIGFTRTDNISKGDVTLHGAGFTASTSVVGIDLADDTIDQVDKAGTHTQEASGLTGMSNNDIFGISVDLDNGTFQMYRNGSAYGSSYNLDNLADWQAHGMTPTASAAAYQAYRFNFGQDSSFAGNHATANSNADGNGFGSFAYAPPSGYLALCSQNLPNVEILDGTEYFNTVLWTGNQTARSITGVGFRPDWCWMKSRTDASGHRLYDAVRGATKGLSSESTGDEYTESGLTSFDSDGFSLGTQVGTNGNSKNMVGWNWLAGGAAPAQTYAVTVSGDSGANKYRFDGNTTDAPTLNLQEGGTYTFDQSDGSNSGHPLRFSTTSNGTHASGSEYTTGVTTTGTPGNAGAKTVITVAASAATLYYYCTQHSAMGGQVNTNATFGSTHLDGSILSTVSANTKAGFSVVKFTANGVNGATVSHGLSSTPSMIILKNIDVARDWRVYHTAMGATKTLDFNKATTIQGPNAAYWNNTAPTSSVFSIGSVTSVNENTKDFIAYCFHSVEGYSKVGSYTGNGNADGTFVYLGFRPAFWLMRSISDGTHWVIHDSARETENPLDLQLLPNEANAEAASSRPVDFLSNGVKIRFSSYLNDSGQSYLYLAFAESPFKFANAR